MGSTGDGMFKKELAALRKIVNQNPDEKHLVRLLLTFEHRRKSFFVFEWADGSLQDKWNKPDEHMRVRRELGDEWLAKQLFGIASALRAIHGLSAQPQNGDPRSPTEQIFGRHGDIKPENILWFSTHRGDKDVLVLADLGLTRYHSKDTRSKVPWSRLEGCTPTYRPPELEMRDDLSQAYDVWSLGCVFLQFCIWYVEGTEKLKLFEEEREGQTNNPILNFREDNFFNIERLPKGAKGAVVKPAVKKVRYFLALSMYCQGANVRKWTESVSRSRYCTSLAKRMLEFARTRMLVAQPGERARIDEVCQAIQDMMEPQPQAGPSGRPAVRDAGVSFGPQEPVGTREADFPLDAEPGGSDSADGRSDNMDGIASEGLSEKEPLLGSGDKSRASQKKRQDQGRGLSKAGHSRAMDLCRRFVSLLKSFWNWVRWKFII